VTATADPLLAASVIISSRERPKMLLEAVRSILASGRLPKEIVVVDQSDSPHPDLEDMGTVRGCEVRYVHSPTPGVSRGRNLGLRLASQDVVVMLDDDMVVQPDSLELLLAPHTGDGARFVTTGRVLAAPPERPGLAQAQSALVTRSAPETFRGRQSFLVVPGANVALPRHVVLEIGGYDERLGPGTRFPAAEDHDLSLRLLDAECEVRHVPEAIVGHRAWRPKRELTRLRWAYARGMGGFYAKHASLRDRHVLGLAVTEVRRRLSVGVTSIVSAPSMSAAQLISLIGIFAGALEWSVRYRIFRRPAPCKAGRT
jgi:GT2 family glycosyltransferase